MCYQGLQWIFVCTCMNWGEGSSLAVFFFFNSVLFLFLLLVPILHVIV